MEADMKNRKHWKRIVFIFLNVLFPLIVGFSVYVFLKPDTYIYNFIHRIFLLPTYAPTEIFSVCFYNWGCDFLWAYSLNNLLLISLNQFKNTILISSLLTGFVGAFLEFLQLIGSLGGTFDFIDIISEFLAIIISGLIIKIMKVI